MQKTKYKSCFDLMSQDQQTEAMTIICNCQLMDEKIDGKQLPFEYYENCSLTELRRMQKLRIIWYHNLPTTKP